MSIPTNYIAVDNPNIPILSDTQSSTIPYGKFLPTPIAGDQYFDGSVNVMKTYDMYLPNFSLRLFEGEILEDAAFSNQHGQGTDLLGSCLFIKGTVKSILPGQNEGPVSSNWSQNFKFDPNNEFIHMCKGGSDLHFIHLSYSSEYFSQFLPDDQRWADHLKNRIGKRERIMGDHFSAITHLQEQALKNILNCPLDGKLGYMMMETSIIQILLIQMHALFNNDKVSPYPVTNRRDVETIQQLKDYLTSTFLQDHCLQSLAKQFGTNTNKLMNLFKKLFGRSIFEYIGELRMDHAMQLLRDHGMMVTEVARTVGYKNPNHFSCAFKRRYGISPSDLK